jgi:hypothetical protein
VSIGKKHDCPGMDLDFTNPGEVKITMIDYLKGVLEDFTEVITRNSTSPIAYHLFTVQPDDERKLLAETRALAFHHSVAQLPFAARGLERISKPPPPSSQGESGSQTRMIGQS